MDQAVASCRPDPWVGLLAPSGPAGLSIVHSGCAMSAYPERDEASQCRIPLRSRPEARRVYGHKKQGAAFGPTKIQGKTVLVRGLNALAATICTPQAAPVIAGTRLHGGSAASARGAACFATESVGTARAAGCAGTIVVRMDSAFYSAATCQAVRHAGAFSRSRRSWTRRSRPRSLRSARTPGRRSSTRGGSGMTNCGAGSPTPRSPRSPIPRSPPRRARPSPPG